MNEGAQVEARSPLLSIGMPVYNEEKYVSQALDSLLAQDLVDFELIITDNASEDATERICREYAKGDARVRYYRNPANLGSVGNFNRVFKLSSGRYFIWAGGHDLWAPQFASKCVDVLEQDSSVVLCYPRSMVIDAEGKRGALTDSQTDTRNWGVLSRFTLAAWAVGCAWGFCGVFRSRALKETRLMKPVIESDLVLLAELSLLGAFANVPEVLYFPRGKWGDENNPTKRWNRFFANLGPANKGGLQRFPYLGWIHELILGLKHARLGVAKKGLLMASVIPAYLSRYRVYIPRPVRLAVRSFLGGAARRVAQGQL